MRLNVTTHAHTELKFDTCSFSNFPRDEFHWLPAPPLPVKQNIILIPSTPQVSLQRFNWLGTSCHRYHRKTEDAIFICAKLVQFYSVWKVWPSSCQLGPAEPSLLLSYTPRCLAPGAGGSAVSSEAAIVQLELLGKVCTVKDLQIRFTEIHVRS